MARGTLVLVVGPSGVGKDTLIAYARDRLAGDRRFVFPRRFITRAGDDAAEAHAPVTAAAFAGMVSEGVFALSWVAHDLGYGIPVGIADDLAIGRNVVANVSRAVIDEARARFAPLCIVSVTAPAEALAGRLKNRGRETEEAIDSRLDRAAAYVVEGPDVTVIENAGAVEEAGERFLALLRGL